MITKKTPPGPEADYSADPIKIEGTTAQRLRMLHRLSEFRDSNLSLYVDVMVGRVLACAAAAAMPAGPTQRVVVEKFLSDARHDLKARATKPAAFRFPAQGSPTP